MRGPRLRDQELRLEAERRVKFRGTVRVRLEALQFPGNRSTRSELDGRKNVERLKEIFRLDEIRRLDPGNHIPAIINQSYLDDAMRASEISAAALLSDPGACRPDPPWLKLPANYRLTCLHGCDRVQAGREMLLPTDAWWTVDLYLDDANPELITTLVEEYSNEEKPSDGEIYCKIRQYERERNLCFKNRWKSRLSETGQRGLRQIDDDGRLAVAFDDVLEIPGMRPGMRLSTIHTIIDAKCVDEALHYLEHITEVWQGFFRGDKTALPKIDEASVRAVELKAPRYSRRDAQVLQGQLLSGHVFGTFSQEEREAIWSELCSLGCLIPSLSSFFEDVKYLIACAGCLKRLVTVTRRHTIATALGQSFSWESETSDQVILEVAESTFVTRTEQDADRLDLGYRHLWLYAMRHYPQMPTETKKKKKNLLSKPGIESADEEVLSEFAALADRVGFKSIQIDMLRERSSADVEIARNALLKARKCSRYQYDDGLFQANVAHIVKMFATARPLPHEYSSPTLVSDNPDASGKRCGFPDKDAYEQDCKHLFLTYLHSETEVHGEQITSFFVRRSVYRAFFGTSVDLRIITSPHPSTSPNGNGQGIRLSSSQGLITQERLAREVAEDERLERQLQEQLEQQALEQEMLAKKLAEEKLVEKSLAEKLAEEMLAEERLAEERLAEERLAEEMLAEERLAEEILAEERLAEERLAEERLAEERLAEERLAEERLAEERLAEEILAEEMLAEEMLAEERLAEERLAEERIADKKMAQQRGQAREKWEQQKQQQEKQRRQQGERQRREVREADRRAQEATVLGLGGLKANSEERRRKRNTQLDMESVVAGRAPGNQERVPSEGRPVEPLRSREPTAAGPDLDIVRHNSAPLAQGASRVISIRYYILEADKSWKLCRTLRVDPSDLSEVERVAVDYVREGFRLFDNDLGILNEANCFQRVTADRSNAIYVMHEADIDINEQLADSISKQQTSEEELFGLDSSSEDIYSGIE